MRIKLIFYRDAFGKVLRKIVEQISKLKTTGQTVE
jgi:hypothetical protein